MSYNYSFEALSPIDFELLGRDLLQEELGIHLESFSVGADTGIDFRYAGLSGNDIIVQCKHYEKSGFGRLRSQLGLEELSKIKLLSPGRYLLVTSVDLSPEQKDKLLSLLYPYCVTSSDIYGRQDINNLLGRYPNVERRHFKLWLNSTEVLDQIIHSKSANLTTWMLEEIRRRSQLYVENTAFQRARNILDERNICIITGLPGIGKSTLAEMLLMDLLRDGYDIAVLTESITEGTSVYRPVERMAFYYDDFLGDTRLQLAKNEAADLGRFVSAVQRDPTKKLILTTRDYILADARNFSEKFNALPLDLSRCIISLSDYSDSDKGKILFNHLHFSSLSEAHKRAIVSGNIYRQIIHHPNFSPRIIEHVTHSAELPGGVTSAKNFPKYFLHLLDNPQIVWSHAFNVLADEQRVLLLVLGTLPTFVDANHLRLACQSFGNHSQSIPNTQFGMDKFRAALRHMQDSFINAETRAVSEVLIKYWPVREMPKQLTLVRFHNPSVRDFIEHYYQKFEGVLFELLNSTLYFDQCKRLWSEPAIWSTDLDNWRTQWLIDNAQEYVEALRRTYQSPCVQVENTVFGFTPKDEPMLHRCYFVVHVANILGTHEAYKLAEEKVVQLVSTLGEASKTTYRKQDVLDIVSEIGTYQHRNNTAKKSGFDLVRILQARDSLLTATVEVFLNDLDDLEDFKMVSQYYHLAPNRVEYMALWKIQAEFISWVEQHIEHDRLFGVDIYAIRDVAEALDIDIARELPEFAARLELDAIDRPKRYADPQTSMQPALDELAVMFSRLANPE